MGTVTDAATDLAMTVTGQGPPLVLAHGLGCDQTVWQSLAADWARDFQVTTFDYPGCGRATRPRDAHRHGTLAGYAEDLLDVVAAAGPPATIVGHSVSATIALLAVRARPERVARLVLLAPNPRFLDDPATGYRGGFSAADIAEVLTLIDQNFVGWASAFARVVAPTDAGAATMRATLLASEHGSFQSLAALAFHSDVRDVLPHVRTPALILQSAHDAIAPVAVGEYMHAHLAGSRLRVIDAPGHCPHITAPHLIATEVRAYLEAT